MRVTMPEPLRGLTLERKPEHIPVAKTFRDFTGLAGNKAFERSCRDPFTNRKGLELRPAHYRRNHLATPDAVLEGFGYARRRPGGLVASRIGSSGPESATPSPEGHNADRAVHVQQKHFRRVVLCVTSSCAQCSAAVARTIRIDPSVRQACRDKTRDGEEAETG